MLKTQLGGDGWAYRDEEQDEELYENEFERDGKDEAEFHRIVFNSNRDRYSSPSKAEPFFGLTLLRSFGLPCGGAAIVATGANLSMFKTSIKSEARSLINTLL